MIVNQKNIDLVSVAEVMEMLSISKASVYRMMDSGQLPSTRINGSRRIRRADVEAYVNSTFLENE